jgi:hypothetical protein
MIIFPALVGDFPGREVIIQQAGKKISLAINHPAQI